MKPKIIIVMEGGIIQNMLSDVPADIVIIDYDCEGIEEEKLTKIDYFDHYYPSDTYCRIEEPVILPKETKKLYRLIKKDLKAKDNA